MNLLSSSGSTPSLPPNHRQTVINLKKILLSLSSDLHFSHLLLWVPINTREFIPHSFKHGWRETGVVMTQWPPTSLRLSLRRDKAIKPWSTCRRAAAGDSALTARSTSATTDAIMVELTSRQLPAVLTATASAHLHNRKSHCTGHFVIFSLVAFLA